MKTKEKFNLSDKTWARATIKLVRNKAQSENAYMEEDVKEFIKRLKEFIIKNYDITYRPARNIIDKIDKLAGDKLT